MTASAGVGSSAGDRIDVGPHIAGLDPDELLSTYGSPLYVYDLDALRARVERLRAALPAGAAVAYAVKANSSPAVLAALAAAGVGADVASGGELRAVGRAGFAAADTVFTGPGKTDAELAAALEAGVAAITLESLDELDALIDLAPAARPGQGLAFRLVAEGTAEDLPIIGADASAKFGLTEAEAADGLRRLVGEGLLVDGGPYRFRGFHTFGATNVRDADALVAGVVRLAAAAERLAAPHDLALDLLDGGGGLGIPYADDESPLDVEALGRGLAAELATWAERPALRDARLLLEPGRWLVGPIGAYVCTVVRTKDRGGRRIAITDGGIHHLLRPRLVGQDHRVRPVGVAAGREASVATDVVGPLCTGIDLLATGVPSAPPERGDHYAVLDIGAYGYAESMPFFLSHPIPAEIVVEAGAARVSRERIEPA